MSAPGPDPETGASANYADVLWSFMTSTAISPKTPVNAPMMSQPKKLRPRDPAARAVMIAKAIQIKSSIRYSPIRCMFQCLHRIKVVLTCQALLTNAHQGRAHLQKPLNTSLNWGRVGSAKAARPAFWGDGRRTAKRSAAQQVVTSLLALTRGSGCSQKSVRFCFGIWVFFTLKHFTDAVCVGSEFVNDVRKSDTLHAHNVGCNSLCECECASLFDDNVHNDPCNWVSFGWGFSPKQVSHGCSFLNMVGRVASGRSGFLPAIQWSRTLRKGAVSLAGAVIRSFRLGAPRQSHIRMIWLSGNPVDEWRCSVGNLAGACP